jgi:Bacterial pre-peptidase C-terminal domain
MVESGRSDRMSFIWDSRMRLGCVGAAALLIFEGVADDKKPDSPKPEPPAIAVVLPLAVEAGSPQKLTVRGLNLNPVTALRLTGLAPALTAEIKDRGAAAKIDGFDAKRVGDQRLEVELSLPANAPAGTNIALVAVSPDGESKPFPLLVMAAGSILGEQEPNSGFREAAALEPGKAVRGALESLTDVDVFRCDVAAGQTLRAEVMSERLGATLDATLSLYDTQGRPLTSNDDGKGLGRDPRIEFKVPSAGRYLIAVSSVTEKAGAAAVYVLTVTTAP